MKAVTRIFYGTPERIEVKEAEDLLPQSKEVVVKVYATTINRTDCAILQAKPAIMRLMTGWITPNIKILGTDFAGVVEAIGKDVTAFKIGDRVFGFDDNGLLSQAEFMTIAEDKAIIKIPENMSFAQAVASAEGFHYAYNFFNKVNIKPNDKILINGATGAIGSALLQIVKAVGATVTATCKTEHSAMIKSLGADRTIDYTLEDFTRDNEKYDYVFDSVGKSTFYRCKNILKDGGTYISSELGPFIQNPILALTTPLFGKKKVRFPFPTNIKASLNYVSLLANEGKFKPLIDKTYNLNEVKEAYTYVLSAQKVGNVILKIR